MGFGIDAAERGWLPDFMVRLGIRRYLSQFSRSQDRLSCESKGQALEAFCALLDQGPIAPHVAEANAQHYEVPSGFFEKVLGPALKYSCCLWNDRTATLAEAESAMLALSCERAEIQAGQTILELGCGWGSLSLYLAKHYPQCQILAVSNSKTQKQFIDARAASQGFTNLDVLTCDMNAFRVDRRFDRIVSVEMFEHMRNYRQLLKLCSNHLTDGGKLFVHIFCHREANYVFETEGDDHWMGRHFFTGGIMPSVHLLHCFAEDLRVERHWRVNGVHYAKTARAWLDRLDQQRGDVHRILALHQKDGLLAMTRWRLFFLAVEELFAWNHGNDWYVAHYLLKKRSTT